MRDAAHTHTNKNPLFEIKHKFGIRHPRVDKRGAGVEGGMPLYTKRSDTLLKPHLATFRWDATAVLGMNYYTQYERRGWRDRVWWMLGGGTHIWQEGRGGLARVAGNVLLPRDAPACSKDAVIGLGHAQPPKNVQWK